MTSAPTQAQLRRDRPLCYRMMVATCMLTVAFSVIVWRLYDLHVRQGPRLAQEASRKFREDRVLPAHRGSIRDLQDQYLAYDEEVYEIQTDRVHLNDVRSITPCLARVNGVKEKDLTRSLSDDDILKSYLKHVADALSSKLALPEEEVRKRLKSRRPIETLAQNLDEDQAAEWRGYLQSQFIKGIYVKPAVRRHYPTDNRLALIVGGMKDGVGDRGVEKTFEEKLAGVAGVVSVEHDKYGREMPLYRGRVQEPVHGRDVGLTIDMQLQDAIDAIVAQADATYKPHKIMAIVTEAATGSILAMSFLPGHDRSDPNGTNWKNLTIYEPYEPGSTFKMVTFTAAFDMNRVSPDEAINCEGGRYVDPVLHTSLEDDESLGAIPARLVFAHSSNIGTYKIFKRIGQDRFLEYVRSYGFGARTGVELNGESAGHINERHWSNTTYSRFPIGYEVNVTPLQMALAYGAIANGGLLMKPRLIDRIAGGSSGEVETIPPQEVRRVCSAKTAATMRELMKLVVSDGTGSRAKLDGVSVAGKTGTSRRYDPEMVVGHYRDGRPKKGGYRPNEYITSFAGFAPADKPEIVCIVVLDNPKASSPSDIRGGKVAAPIFAEIVAETLKQRSIRLQRPLALQGGAQ